MSRTSHDPPHTPFPLAPACRGAPVAAGHTEVVEPTVVCKLEHRAALRLVQAQPEAMERFFWTLATLLAKRVSTASKETRRLLEPVRRMSALQLREAQQAAEARNGRSALALAIAFGLRSTNVVAGDRYAAERELLCAVQCSVSEEASGRCARCVLIVCTAAMQDAATCCDRCCCCITAKTSPPLPEKHHHLTLPRVLLCICLVCYTAPHHAG